MLLLEPGTIGTVRTRNRIVRAGTTTSMADPGGAVTDPLIATYERLAAGGVGLIITGHLFVDARGKAHARQPGIHEDHLLPGLERLTQAVHARGGAVFAQLSHAGSQTRAPEVDLPLGPSAIPNPMSGRIPVAASEHEIEQVVASFGRAARRAADVGFDGVHIHGANGYLISEFVSPITNGRTDRWGPGWDGAFPTAVIDAVRDAVPPGFPVSLKLGAFDVPEGGVSSGGGLDPGIDRLLRSRSLEAIEVSSNLMLRPSDSAHEYVAVDGRRARQDWLLHRLGSTPAPEAYHRDWASRLADRADATKIILVGGMRNAATMEDVLSKGDADLIALARPFIREPEFVRRIEAEGLTAAAACTSCNLCMEHSGEETLRCWRVPRHRLLQHLAVTVRRRWKR